MLMSYHFVKTKELKLKNCQKFSTGLSEKIEDKTTLSNPFN